jgi:hypothetical protein
VIPDGDRSICVLIEKTKLNYLIISLINRQIYNTTIFIIIVWLEYYSKLKNYYVIIIWSYIEVKRLYFDFTWHLVFFITLIEKNKYKLYNINLLY